MHIRSYTSTDETAVIKLWHECNLTVPWNNPAKDIARKLTVGADLFLVGEINGVLVGSIMGGYEGHRGWINYLAVSPTHQRKGYGRELVAEVEKLLLAKGCPKINLQVRAGNLSVIEFYKAIGFNTDEVVSLGKRLIPD